ncbi:hypothetical protein [Curtobacterium sp. MCBD17_032]|uniref:hypothetical protein n=1 Tax=Curtobacterium sp. MCBD17_032 TaxID=2175659 RepID=UPI0011B83A72|nr:hypothetical protein [Curtobacterium sp. MCBD17_032]
MEDEHERAVAVRAVASYRPSRSRRRPVRVCRYDAWWPDGHITHDVSFSRATGRRAPADLETLVRQVQGACPRIGVGRWIDEHGAVLVGPAEPSVPPGAGAGRPVPWPPSGPPVVGRSRRASVRLGLGTAGVLLLGGAVVLVRVSPTDPLGVVGVLCGIVGVVLGRAALRRRR